MFGRAAGQSGFSSATPKPMNGAMLYVKQNASLLSRLRRFGVPVLAFSLLVVIGRQFTPQSSMAGVRPLELQSGSLVGPRYIVELVVTVNGPRYNVRTESGRLLAAMLDQDALAREYPNLDLRTATAQPLMSAERHTPDVSQ